MSSTEYRNKNLRRPRKSGGVKARRERLQRERLIALGMSDAEVNKMDTKQVREKLKYPKKIQAAYASA